MSKLEGPEGALVELTCTPTGPELCFDAIDNNCNGLLDEGCGVPTGPLHFAIAWDNDLDVDLDVTDPQGVAARLERSPGARGHNLVKDRDCGGKSDPCRGQDIENVFSAERPILGAYQVRVRINGTHGSERFPMRVRFGGRVGARTFSTVLEFASGTETKRFVVSVGADIL